MPCYPELALLLGAAIAENSTAVWRRRGQIALAVVASLAGLVIVYLLARVWNLPAYGDISRALTQNPENYTLSLGHMGDLTIPSFAYLKLPLLLAGLAFAMSHPRKLTPHQPGVTGNAWRLRRPQRQQASRSHGERSPRLSPVLD